MQCSNNPGILQSGFIWGGTEFAGKFGVLPLPSISEIITNQETVYTLTSVYDRHDLISFAVNVILHFWNTDK